MHKYKLHGKKGEGTFSEVLKAQDIKTGKLVAIKCMKNHFDSVEQVNRLREIQALRRLSPHANIIKLHEVLYDRSTGRLALVFELMEMNIYELIRGRRQYLAEDKILHYMYQLLKSIDHMHKNGIFHRDIKPENVLILNDALKLADFGSCRGIYSKQPFTEYISTRWYRAPECLLTDGYYNYKMDVWGVGCVFFEIMSLYPLFPGTNELDQIHKIHNIMGTPPAELLNRLKKHGTHMDFDFPQKQGTGITKLLPHASPDALDLMTKLLIYNPDDRASAKQALRHPYFREIRELDKRLRKANKAGGVREMGAGDDDGEDHMSDTGASRKEEPEEKLPPLGAEPAPAAAAPSKGLPALGNSKSTSKAHGASHGAAHHGAVKSEKSLPKLAPMGKK
jgi:renal tumor antigen